MKRTTTLAAAAALGLGVLPGAAHAQDVLRDYDQRLSAESAEGDAVRMRFSLPFGGRSASNADDYAPRLSFGFQGDFGGEQRQLDMLSFSLTGGAPRVETPIAFNAAGDGEGGWFSRPLNWLILGVGVGVAYAIYEHNEDDDDPA
ncbi:MAG: hypothetical protein K2X34_12820, partial [Hyphomonadaceae bacterium]|nr:hypothetical protein [Hyphomonadaceae bacterium]